MKNKPKVVKGWAVSCGYDACYCLTAYTVKEVAKNNAMNGEKIFPCTITLTPKRKAKHDK